MNYLRKLSAVLLAAALLLSLFPAASASEVYGQQLRSKTTPVAPGVAHTAQSVWAGSDGLPRTEHFLTYSPGAWVKPVARWGDYVVSLRTLEQMARDLEEEGLRVVGGINASFFNYDGSPVGVVISGGRLISANPEFQVIGFKADGSALMGQPAVTLSASWTAPEKIGFGEDGGNVLLPAQEQEIPLSGLNKIRSAGGYYLISDDYAATTQNSLDGVDVVLRPAEEQRGLPLSGDVPCEVLAVRASLSDTSIPQGCFVLSVNDRSDAAMLAALRELQIGGQVTLHVSISEGWEEVTEALSGLHSLITDGAANPSLPWDGRAPRTAVGLKQDGSVIFYTVDGRQNGYSVGATYTELACRMIELGCVSAVALDGGGSTCLGTTWPDSEGFQMVNRPSDGKARAVSTCLFLVQDAQLATGELGGFVVDAVDGPVLAGTSFPVSALPIDTACRALPWSGELAWSAALGSIEPDGSGGWTYTAPAAETVTGVVTDTITVTGGGAAGTACVAVAASPSLLRLANAQNGEAVTALELQAGESIQLAASANLYSWPLRGAVFAWSVSPEVGTVDENGLFTAGETAGSGTLTVQCGTQTLSVPVTVSVAPPPEPEQPLFADIAGHWAERDILRLYEHNIAQGTVEADGLRYFYPSQHLTRQEWAVFMIRLLGADTTQYDGVELPFVDTDTIASWALPYVRAAYAMELMTGSWSSAGQLIHGQADITREEAMTLLGRGLDLPEEADLSVFSDAAEVSPWALPYVKALVARGIVGGSDGKLNPSAPITRAEAAKLLSRLLPEQDVPQDTPPEAEGIPQTVSFRMPSARS